MWEPREREREQGTKREGRKGAREAASERMHAVARGREGDTETEREREREREREKEGGKDRHREEDKKRGTETERKKRERGRKDWVGQGLALNP